MTLFNLRLFAPTVITVAATLQSFAADTLVVLPREITLTGPEARQALLVEMAEESPTAGLLVTGPVREGVVFQTENEAVAKVVDGRVVPVGNGSTTIKVSAGGQVATAKVTVEMFEVAHQWSVRNHVQSVLSKTGCNGGACHGAAAGKSGFKLSLRGYDPEADFFAITRQARGRRVVPHDPGRSLVLTKPTGAIPHKGGIRFAEDSPEYRVVSEWIAQGQVSPSADDARINRLEILPASSRLKAGVEQPMVVRAHFSDGRVEDVTRWAKYTSTNATVCSVDDKGVVKVSGSGEGAIVAW